MARRNDGRIEPGQKLSTAISARAWNRAQDAADIVLGQRIGFGAGAGRGFTQSLVVPARVTTSIQDVGIGHVVQLFNRDNSAIVRTPNLTQNETFGPEFSALRGQVHIPTAFSISNNTFREVYRLAFGVIVGGAQMPRPGVSRVVDLCIAGMCFARVRARHATTSGGAFVQPSMLRVNSDTVENLTGVFDQTDAGIARLVYADQEPKVFSTDGTEVYWGLVVL
jgi:hypothetical protein